MIRLMVVGLVVLLASWALLVVLAARLPDGTLKDLARFLPDCVTMARRLGRDPRVPRRAKVAVGFAALWVLSPIDLIPEFLPVIGPLDDVLVVALALRLRRSPYPGPGPPRRMARSPGADGASARPPGSEGMRTTATSSMRSVAITCSPG